MTATNKPKIEVWYPRKPEAFAVFYASAGCLPDSDSPEFVGTLQECEAWVAENASDYERPDVQHDLYSLEIVKFWDVWGHDWELQNETQDE